VKVKKESQKLDGSFLKFKVNTNILLKKRLTPKGKEIMGPGVFKLKRKKFLMTFIKIL